MASGIRTIQGAWAWAACVGLAVLPVGAQQGAGGDVWDRDVQKHGATPYAQLTMKLKPDAFEAWVEKAEAGDAVAADFVFYAHKMGVGTPSDRNQEVRWFKIALEKGAPITSFYHARDLRYQLKIKEADALFKKVIDKLAVAARSGDRCAQVFRGRALIQLGQMGQLGLLGRPDRGRQAKAEQQLDEGRQLVIASAKAGYAPAEEMYGDLIGRKVIEGTEQEAIDWYRRAADSGLPSPQNKLGKKLLVGRGVPKDQVQGLMLINLSAERGWRYSQYLMGLYSSRGWYGVKQDYKAALKWYEKAAIQNHPTAQTNLGVLHVNGEGTPRDWRKAEYWYLKAVEQNFGFAMNCMATMHATGMAGAKKDQKLATEWYRRGAEAGDLFSRYWYAVRLLNGLGAEPDVKEAVRRLTELAGEGDQGGMYQLGLLYYEGKHAPKDPAKAFQWFSKAMEAGSKTPSHFYLGVCYQEGLGTEKDYAQALKWLKISQRANWPQSSYRLGLHYENGWGVEVDLQKALQLYEKEKWHKPAKEAMERVKEKLKSSP